MFTFHHPSSFLEHHSHSSMAEAAVAVAVGLIQLITPYLNEMNLPKDIKEEDLKSMKSWLTSLQAFMDDNDGREGSHWLHDLVHKVRTTAYDIEDTLDDFLFHSPPYYFHRHRSSRRIHTNAHHLRHIFPFRGVSQRIASIKKDIDDIKSQTSAFGGRFSILAARPTKNRVVGPLLIEDCMVGYGDDKKWLMSRLVDDKKRSLVRLAVDGPPGSGKTTLVKNVFSEQEIQSGFDCRAWVCLGRHPDMEKIIETLIKQLCSPRDEPYPDDDGSTLQTRLRRYLTGKTYLIVLDDIWSYQCWRDLEDLLPESFSGSRVIATTRHSKLSSKYASSTGGDAAYTLSLRGLHSVDARKLFCGRAFPSGECPSELKGISEKIVERCEGLPLAIVEVAKTLERMPQTLCQWKGFHRDLGWEIWNLGSISDALLRSYMHLRSSLKCCFLYMCIFPEYHDVECGRLIRLWVAESFAIRTQNETAEEIAEGYMNKLISRNLIHVTDRHFDGRPRRCRMHNIILQFFIEKCKKETFASIYSQEDNTLNQSETKIRRLSIHHHCNHFPKNADFSAVRSMFLLRFDEKIAPADLDKNLQKLKLIKVVDVQGAFLTEFPKEITRFTLLRYLNFRDTKIQSIPSSIKKLSYLETLDLKRTLVTVLPPEISTLLNLCHLFVYNETAPGVELRQGINNLTNLQNLSLVKIDVKGGTLNELKALTQLRKLRLTGLRREHGKVLCAAVEGMKCLKTLDITSKKGDFIELQEMKNPPKKLERLYLKGRLGETAPWWVSELHSLVKIRLKWSKLRHTPLGALKGLPNLVEVYMIDCFGGEELRFEASGFKKLKTLLIEDLSTIVSIVMEDGALPHLKMLSLRRCPRLVKERGVKELVLKVKELDFTLLGIPHELVAQLTLSN